MNAARSGDQEISAELRRADQWCDDACNRWYDSARKRPYHFAVALHAARTDPPQDNAVELLLELLGKRGEDAPAISRASALGELLRVDPQAASLVAIETRKDPSPIVRASAAYAARGEVSVTKRLAIVKPLLGDAVRAVRVEAAKTALTTIPQLDPFRNSEGQKALSELRSSFQIDIDRAAGNMNLGNLEQQLGNFQAAVKHYENAIRIEPNMVGPRSNYAQLLESLAEENQSNDLKLKQTLLQRAKQLRQEELPLLERDLAYSPGNPAIEYRLGLAYYLDGKLDRAEQHLRNASELDPKSPSYSLTYALLLEKLGRRSDAIEELTRYRKIDSANNDVEQTWRRLNSQ